jgi:hypothetical protein
MNQVQALHIAFELYCNDNPERELLEELLRECRFFISLHSEAWGKFDERGHDIWSIMIDDTPKTVSTTAHETVIFVDDVTGEAWFLGEDRPSNKQNWVVPSENDASVLAPLSFYEMLDSMRKNFPMHFGHHSLELLKIYLTGLWDARRYGNVPISEEQKEFLGFWFFVRQKYRRTEDSMHWANWIIQRCNGDGKEAVDEFYRLFDQFREEKRKDKTRKERQRKKETQQPKSAKHK